jgi:TolB protein
MRIPPFLVLTALVGLLATTAVFTGPRQDPTKPPPPQQQTELNLKISGDANAPPRYAVPNFIALTSDAETLAAAQTIGQVLWDDLAFEREFDLIPRDTYASIPRARTLNDVPFDQWRELGADGLVMGTVERKGTEVRVEVRLFRVRDRSTALGKEYRGAITNPRLYAHTIADEIFQSQVGLRGVARTRLTFDSDRDGERVTRTVESRQVKEIYIADYDGANQRRVTTNRTLNITPVWSPDGRGIAYTSYRRGFPDIFVALIYQGESLNPTKGIGQNTLPAYSPDGSKIAFMSSRDGNPEIYVMNADGSAVRRLTNNSANDVTPTWSPNGLQIAFTSDRSGGPQIYVISADGLEAPRKITSEPYCDRPTWSPLPYSEIAYAARAGGSIDIKVLDLTSGHVRQLTFGGINESPAYAPNGRHLAFTSNRTGKHEIFTIGRDGKGLQQITKLGNNEMPNWSSR